MEFSEILRQLREKHGYTQEKLGEVLHLSKNSISHYELNISKPSTDTLIDIANLFDVTLDFLLGRTECNLSQGLLKQSISKGVSVEHFIEKVLRMDSSHKADLVRLMQYIYSDDKRLK